MDEQHEEVDVIRIPRIVGVKNGFLVVDGEKEIRVVTRPAVPVRPDEHRDAPQDQPGR